MHAVDDADAKKVKRGECRERKAHDLMDASTQAPELFPCAICADDRPYFVICPRCQADACTECYAHVFTGIEFRCMHCRETMTRDFVIRQMGDEWFHTVYVPFMMDAVMKQEHKALPAAQEILELLDRAAALYAKRKTLTDWAPDYFALMEEAMELMAPDDWAHAAPARHMRVSLYYDVHTQLGLRGAHAPADQYQEYTYGRDHVERKQVKAAGPRITGKCPADDCRGFLVADVCGVCATRVCGACRAVLRDRDHTCRREDIEAVALIARDTKPCPKCYAPIAKLSGCDQMWCVCCQTTFSWNTGEIQTGPVHNPHYWEWRRQHGVAEHAPPACANPERLMLHTLNVLYRSVDRGGLVSLEPWIFEIEHMARTYRHVHGVVLSNYRHKLSRRFGPLCLRLRYLRGDIDDAVWRRTLQRRILGDMRIRGMIELVETWTQTIADLVGQPVPTVAEMSGFIRGIVTQYRAFLDYLNGLCDDLSTMYRFKVPVLVDMMPEMTTRYRKTPEPHPDFADLAPYPAAYQAWA